MKTPTLLTLALLGLAGSASLFAGGAGNSATIELDDVTLRHGLDQTEKATTPINEATEYTYTISGTVDGSGPVFDDLFPNGTSIAAALDQIQPGSSSALSGIVFNPSGTHKYTVLNKVIKGSEGALKAKAKIVAGIDNNSFAFFKLTGVSLTTPFGPDTADRIEFNDDAQVSISIIAPPPGDGRADAMILVNGNVGIGNDVINTTGEGQSLQETVKRNKSKTFFVMVHNDRQGTETFNVGAPGDTDKLKRKYFDGSTNVTPEVTGTTGYSFSLAGGAIKVLKVKTTVTKDAVSEEVLDTIVTADPQGSAPSDAVKLAVQVQ